MTTRSTTRRITPTSDEHVLLAFDLASRTGWAVRDEEDKLRWGSHKFFKGHVEPNVFFPAASEWIEDMIHRTIPTFIITEKWSHLQGHAVEILWGLHGVLMSHCADTVVLPIPPGQWKRKVFGVGTVHVDRLAEEMNKLGHAVTDCDEAAALGLLLAGEMFLKEHGML